MTRDGKTLLVGVGKGNQTHPNPIDKEKAEDRPVKPGRNLPFPYIGTTLSGTLSLVPVPDEEQLAAYTEQVYRNCPYSDKLLSDAPTERQTAVPTKVGAPSPIKHVIYIIKENRTYDQVFGDMPRGNGDPSLCMFPEEVTPNHHKLAREFVLLDNLYCNGQVSRDGHPWSTMAYNTDYTARDWLLTYSGRGGVDDDDEGSLSNAPSGYIWDACARAGLSYRSYGEYGKRVSQPDGSTRVEGRVPGLIGHICPDYGIPKVAGQRTRDTDNVVTFLKEFREFEQNGNLPSFIVMSLGEDHTSGTTLGAFTPQACVASNDLALGQLVEAVSKSKYWPETAIFVIEDDAQNGPDHVDAHRTVGLVVSPYVRRGHLDSTQYQTASMLRTIELILGLPPLSQFDAAANPMFESFTDTADATPYEHVPARIDLNAVNTKLAYGWERSNQMDFSEYDRIDDFELNEILWFAVMGRDAPLPGPVRRAIAFRPLRSTAAPADTPSDPR
ncbi:MAG: alkaline phosphatase family protein, partial [Pirellulales bacterium]